MKLFRYPSRWKSASIGMVLQLRLWEAQSTLGCGVLLVDCFPSVSFRRIFLVAHPASLRGCAGYIFCERQKRRKEDRERVGGRGREGWVRTRGALNYPEMLTPGGDGAGIGENSPPRKRWAPVQWHLSEAGELLAQPPHKASIRLSVLLSWLSLLCRIKKQHVLPVSVGFP